MDELVQKSVSDALSRRKAEQDAELKKRLAEQLDIDKKAQDKIYRSL